MEISDRAVPQVDISRYPELAMALQGNAVAARVGAIYPDWGYAWNSLSAGAEDAHWPDFHTTALAHLEANYNRPWSLHAAFCRRLEGHPPSS